MAPCPIEQAAKTELESLATWIKITAEMAEVAKNTLKCVDKNLREKMRPFLTAQKYSKMKVRFLAHTDVDK